MEVLLWDSINNGPASARNFPDLPRVHAYLHVVVRVDSRVSCHLQLEPQTWGEKTRSDELY